MDTRDVKLLQDMLDDLEHLIDKTNQMYIPDKYHTTSLKPEAMCDLSYRTGMRDQMHSQRCQIKYALMVAEERVADELDDNYREHLENKKCI